jgi:hypothetical protein
MSVVDALRMTATERRRKAFTDVCRSARTGEDDAQRRIREQSPQEARKRAVVPNQLRHLRPQRRLLRDLARREARAALLELRGGETERHRLAHAQNRYAAPST